MAQSVSVPRYGFADEPHTCAWYACQQTVHLTAMVTLGRDHFHMACWHERAVHEVKVWEGEAR